MKNTRDILSILRLSLLFAVSILFTTQSVWGVTASDYSSLNDKSAATLWSAVHTKSKSGLSSLTYSGLWTAYKTSDLYPTDTSHPDYDASKAGKVWDLYGGCAFTYSTDQCGSYSSECDCYNREHSIPKSWFGGSESQNTPGTDIFHVVPTDGKINNTRQNYAFGEVQTAKTTHTTNGLVNKLSTAGGGKSITIENTMLGTTSTQSPGSSKQVFEPPSVYKGDFARGYFGTLLTWAGDYQAFTTGDGAVMFSGTYTAAGHWGLTPYGLALLLKWHREDPVSQKEIDRNNGIESTQGNRNPFIDYPILAEYIWGKYAGNTFNTSNAVGSFESAFIAGVSDGDKATGPTITVSPTSIAMTSTTGNSKTATFTITGANLTGGISITNTAGGTGFSINTSLIAAANANGSNTITITYLPTSGSSHNVTYTISSTGATDVTITVTGSCVAARTVNWYVNGSVVSTESVPNDTKVSALPTNPSPPSGCEGKTFVGWTKTAINSATNTKPTDLFTDVAGSPTITENKNFYAVFATVSQGSGSSGTVTETMSTTSPYVSQTGWTASAGGTYTSSGNYGASSPSIQLKATNHYVQSATMGGPITSVSYWYKPQSATGSIDFYVSTDGSTFTELTAEKVSFSSSNTSGTKSITLNASDGYRAIKIVYTKTTSNLALDDISITYGGSVTTYSGYVTSCTACTPTDPTASFNSPTTSVYVGASVTNTVTTNSDGVVTYSSSDTNVATVDATTGQVTGVAAGSATITASIAASTCYNAKTASYTITVNAVPTCTITWSVDGTTSSTTLNVGATLSVPTVNNCTGGTRVFKGWTTNSSYTSNDGSGLVTPTSPVAGNATYYAVYADETAGTGTETTTYNKVTSAPSNWAGEYLLVYESSATAGVAWTGVDAANCNTAVTIASSVISTKPSDAATLTIASMTGGYSILVNGGTNDGKYIGRSDDSNGMNWGTSALANTFAYDGTNSCITITGAGNAVLRYNNAANNYRFRYFKSSTYTNQQAIQLYKKTTTTTGGTATTYSNYSTHCSAAPTTYTITWKDGDGNTLKTEEVAVGSTPSYAGTTPTKTATAQYTYTFNNSWSPSIVSVTEPATYTAQFSSTLRQYNILWKNEDGTSTLETDANQNYGAATAFNGSTPTKAATAQYTYTFDGWATEANGAKVYNNGSTPTVSGTATYYAHFSSTVNSYSVTFKDNFGTTLNTQTVNYGSAATAPSIPEINCYTHGTWDKAYNNITGDLTVTVNYTIIPYTVTAVPDNNSHGSTSITEQ